MSDDGARYLEQVIRERDAWRRIAELRGSEQVIKDRDDWHRIANERAAELVRMNSAIREIVFVLALRKRSARNALRKAEREFTRPAGRLDALRALDVTFLEACSAYDGARRTLRRNTRRTLERVE